MHFSPKLHMHHSKSPSSAHSQSGHSADHDESESASASPPSKAKDSEERDRGAANGYKEREEEVTSWIEGRDVVIEITPCTPGEDVRVEVLRGAADSYRDQSRSKSRSKSRSRSVDGHKSDRGHDEKTKKKEAKEMKEMKEMKEALEKRGRKLKEELVREVKETGLGTDMGKT